MSQAKPSPETKATPDVSKLPLLKGINKSLQATTSYKAYQYWMANSYQTLTEVACKMGVSGCGIRSFIRKYKLARPDGKETTANGHKTNRQKAIGQAYKMAVKKGWNARDAAMWVQEQTKQTCQRGDIQYWAMKNNLPYLPEASSMAKRYEPTA
jgi:hypothetical protein